MRGRGYVRPVQAFEVRCGECGGLAPHLSGRERDGLCGVAKAATGKTHPLSRTHTETACSGVTAAHRGKAEGSKHTGAGSIAGVWEPFAGPGCGPGAWLPTAGRRVVERSAFAGWGRGRLSPALGVSTAD